MENSFIQALKNNKKVYDSNGNQYKWNDKNNEIVAYYYLDADAILSNSKPISIDHFEKLMIDGKLTIGE